MGGPWERGADLHQDKVSYANEAAAKDNNVMNTPHFLSDISNKSFFNGI